MALINDFIYIVYGAKLEDNNPILHYFLNEKDACLFAIKNVGKISYGVPRVVRVEFDYDTNNLGYKYYDKTSTVLFDEDIFQYEEDKEELRRINYGSMF